MKDILLIDDEADVLYILKSILNTKGYHIRAATGGEEGLKKLKQQAPDLIICDLMMPKVSGRDIIKFVKEDDKLKNIPFITVSAVGAEQDKPETFWAQGLGVDEYLFKPFDPMDLLGKVEALLRSSNYEVEKIQQQETASQPRPEKTVQLPPVDTAASEIARKYVLCWNDANWDLEYNLMAPEMTQAYGLDVYTEARERSRKDDMHQSLEIISEPSETISGKSATVVFEIKAKTSAGREHLKQSTVTLRQSDKGWRVLRVKDQTL